MNLSKRKKLVIEIANKKKIDKLPAHMIDMYHKIEKIKEDFFQEFGREATYEEISKIIGNNMTPSKVKELCELMISKQGE